MINIATATVGGAAYRRRDGRTYRKISESLHIQAYWRGGIWIEDGCTERLDPNELVNVVG
jgi:hypothetical protein